VPVIKGEFIVRDQGIWAQGVGAPLVFLDDVPIVPLVRLISAEMQCADLIRIWSCAVPPIDGTRILNYLLNRGILEISSVATCRPVLRQNPTSST